jgi:phospholipase/lecithinase/hemolysin
MLALVLVTLARIAQADPLDTWTLINPLPTGNHLSAITYGNGQFVAVGDLGTIVTSADGLTWAERHSGTTNGLTTIAYGNGRFVAAGAGVIVTSADGVNWIVRPFLGNGGLFNTSAIVYGNGQFVAWEQADSGKPGILTSIDGVEWQWAFWPLDSNIFAIAHGDGQFVAVGASSANSSGAIATSDDGVNWVQRPSGTDKSLNGIAYGNGLFVAVGTSHADGSGGVVTSTDGMNWVERQSWKTNSLEQIAYGNGQFLALGHAYSLTQDILTSADGFVWIPRQPGTQMDLSAVTCGKGRFLAVGDNGTILASGNILLPFNSMYCFGFSWTDTHNCSWDPTKYWHNHACNGPMWPEFLSTNLGVAYVEANNYAVCGATSSDILSQVVNAPVPSKPNLGLYCLWADGPDVDFATMVNALTNEVAGNLLLQTTLLNISNSVNQLYIKGARAIFIEWSSANWVSTLRRDQYLSLFGTNSALLSKDSNYVARFSAGFLDTIDRCRQTKPDLRILLLDVWPMINDIRANPTQYGFTVTSIDALDDPALTDKSFTGPGAAYLYWDGHGTSKLHELIATWHLDALTNSILETLQATVGSGSPIVQMNHLQIGRQYMLQSSFDLRTWQTATSFTASAGTNQWIAAGSGTASGFYRLTWQP